MSNKKTSWKRFQRLRLSRKALNQRVQKIEKGTIRHAHRFVMSRLDRLSGVRRHVLSWLVLVMLLVSLSATQWIVFRDNYSFRAPAAGGTYSEGVLGPLATLNPLYARSNAEKSAARLLFASLYNYDTTGHLKGDMVDRLTISQDEMNYTVTLKRGLKWSDGVPITAKDVVFTVSLLQNPNTNSEITGWQLAKATALDDQTVRFTLAAPYAPFMHALTFPVLPQHSLADVHPSELRQHKYSQSPVTSGPFALRLVQNAAADGTKKIVHLVANTYYHAGTPKLERFQLYVYPSRDDIVRGLRVSEIIATPELMYDAQKDQAIQQNYTSQSYGVNNGVYAIFNTAASGPLQSQKVRHALFGSVNIQALRRKLSRASEVLDGPILPHQVEGSLPRYDKPDVAKAKRLLDEDGWTLQNNQRRKGNDALKLSLVALKGHTYEEAAQYLAAVWRQALNVEVDIRVVDPADTSQDILQTVLQPRQFDVLVYEFVLGGDPDVYAYWHSSEANPRGLNFANYNSAIADEALAGGRAKLSSKQRLDKYRAFVKYWYADAPAIPLYQAKIDYIHLPSAQTIAPSARLVSPTDRYANVLHWTIRSAPVYKTP